MSASFDVRRDKLGVHAAGPLERALSVSFVSVSLKMAPYPLPGAPSVVLCGGYLREPWNSTEAWGSHRPEGYSEEEP